MVIHMDVHFSKQLHSYTHIRPTSHEYWNASKLGSRYKTNSINLACFIHRYYAFQNKSLVCIVDLIHPFVGSFLSLSFQPFTPSRHLSTAKKTVLFVSPKDLSSQSSTELHCELDMHPLHDHHPSNNTHQATMHQATIHQATIHQARHREQALLQDSHASCQSCLKLAMIKVNLLNLVQFHSYTVPKAISGEILSLKYIYIELRLMNDA